LSRVILGYLGMSLRQIEKSILVDKFSLCVGAEKNICTCVHVALFDALAHCVFVCFAQ